MLVIELIKTTVWLLLSVIQLAMLIRAIMSWFVRGSNSLTTFLDAITEPFIYPVRWLFDKMNWATRSPIDIPAFIAFLVLSILTTVLTP